MAVDNIGFSSREDPLENLNSFIDGIVDVELDREHYDVAIDKAMAIYRQLSSTVKKV